jgi:hypothetical protein
MSVYYLKLKTVTLDRVRAIEKILLAQDVVDLFAPQAMQVETTWNKPYMMIWRTCDPVVIKII